MKENVSQAFRLVVSVIVVTCSVFGLLLVLGGPPLPVAARGTVPAASRCLQPPRGVDLTTLSDQALTSYDLPTQALIRANPQQWKRVLSLVRQHTCGTSAGKLHITHHFQPASPAGEQGSSNWSGNVASGSRGTYRIASVEFNTPSISFSNPSAASSIWAGVGGACCGQYLVQTGVSTQIINGRQYNESFWEEVPGYSEQNLPLDRLNPGDRVYAYAESNYENDGENYFFIENKSDGSYNSHLLRNNIFSDSATGECIVERPTINGQLPPLLELNPNGNPKNSETLNNCTIQTNSASNGIGNWLHYYYDMYNGNDLLAYPGPITNGGYDYIVYWVAST